MYTRDFMYIEAQSSFFTSRTWAAGADEAGADAAAAADDEGDDCDYCDRSG